MSTLFSCCAHQKDVIESRSRAPGQGGRGQSRFKAETFLAFVRSVETAKLLAF